MKITKKILLEAVKEANKEQKKIMEARTDCCFKCGKKLIPAKDCVRDDTGKWDGHTYKYDCKCFNSNLRISIG